MLSGTAPNLLEDKLERKQLKMNKTELKEIWKKLLSVA